jgi:hypothetical protein
MTTTQRLLIGLTVVNVVLLLVFVVQPRAAAADGAAPVLRGRALEIVDDRGRVRASIVVHPADPTFAMPDGSKGYPETVMLRLVDPNGRPNVKLGASDQGAVLGLGGQSDPTYALLVARGASTSLKLTNKDGREQTVTP